MKTSFRHSFSCGFSSSFRLGAVVVAGAWALPALAYIPPSQYVVKTMASKHAGFKGIRLRTQVSAIEQERPTGAHFKEVALYDPQTRVLRSRAYNDSGKELYAVERRLPSSATHVPSSGIRALLADCLMLDSNAEVVTQLLKNAWIPIRSEAELQEMKDEDERRSSEVMFFGRWRGAVSWVIGRDRKDSPQPQLWVEKDSFLPTRLIGRIDDDMESMDLRFENYRFFRDLPLPKTVSLAKAFKDQTVLRAELNDAQINPEMTEMKGTLTQGFTEAGYSSDASVRELILEFYKKLR